MQNKPASPSLNIIKNSLADKIDYILTIIFGGLSGYTYLYLSPSTLDTIITSDDKKIVGEQVIENPEKF